MKHYFGLYLSPVDLYWLSRSCAHFRRVFSLGEIKKILHKKIADRLACFFSDDFAEFKEIMDKTGVVLSGSFILQVALDEVYGSDLDFYAKNDGPIAKFFKKCGRKTGKYSEDSKRYRRNRHISMHRSYFYRGRQLQIATTVEDPWVCIRGTGFDICRNQFSFGELKMMNLVGVFNKCTRFDILDADDFCYRREKYQERGFRFKPICDFRYYLEYLMFVDDKIKRVVKSSDPKGVSMYYLESIFTGNFRMHREILYIPKGYFISSFFFSKEKLSLTRQKYLPHIECVKDYLKYFS